MPTAVGIGGENSLVFDDVMVPEDGRYVLRVLYTGGDNKDLSIQANENEPINSYLHNTSGWAFPTGRLPEKKNL